MGAGLIFTFKIHHGNKPSIILEKSFLRSISLLKICLNIPSPFFSLHSRIFSKPWDLNFLHFTEEILRSTKTALYFKVHYKAKKILFYNNFLNIRWELDQWDSMLCWSCNCLYMLSSVSTLFRVRSMELTDLWTSAIYGTQLSMELSDLCETQWFI
jgi:hypothetical protein